MKTARLSLLFFVTVVSFAAPGPAQAWEGFQLFAKKDEEAGSSKGPANSFRTTPRNERSTARDEDEPSVFDRMNQSTRNFFAKTKDALTPNAGPPKQPKIKARTSAKSAGWWGGNSAKKSTPASSGGGFFSWFKKEEPRPSKTMGDFLGQPRP